MLKAENVLTPAVLQTMYRQRKALQRLTLGEKSFQVLYLPVLRIWIWDPVPFWPLDPGSRIGFFSGSRISDPGSRIPNPYFLELFDNFFGKKFYNSLKIGPNYFLQHFKNKIIFKLWNLWLKFFFTPLFCCCFWIRDRYPGSGIRDPGSGMGKIQDPGSGINIPVSNTSTHCSLKPVQYNYCKYYLESN